MLIRIRGGISGIKSYLENGQKQGRGFSRDELDERVSLHGDLGVTDEIIKRIESSGEKYLHITLSFKEDEIDRETLESIVADFEKFAFSAYKPEEYNFFAEAHLPKIKSYTNEKTGEFTERKPHIHIVVPKINLLSGQHLNPFGLVERQTKYIDSFQESINQKYGLASPKDNRRIEFTGESEMVSRFKGDYFDGPANELKNDILNTIIEARIESLDALKDALAGMGAVKERGAGKPGAYLNIKPDGAAKGTNLKDYVFSREFLALPHDEKLRKLAVGGSHEYIQPNPVQQSTRVDEWVQEWHASKAREIKYLNSGNRKLYKDYRAADDDGKRQIIDTLEQNFYQKHKEHEHERTAEAGNRKPCFVAPFRKLAPKSFNHMRSLSGIDVARPAERPEMLLPSDALLHMDENRADRHRGLRWSDDGGVTAQYLRDQDEQQQAVVDQSDRTREIKANLDGRRLLLALSHTHGLIPEKYEVTKAEDGSDRVRCGARNLNVTDFLTKELHLPWNEARRLVEQVYDEQTKAEDLKPRKNEPARTLWAEFQRTRKNGTENPFQLQRRKERERIAEVKEAFYKERGRLEHIGLSKQQSRAEVSLLRVARIEREAALRELFKAERAALRTKKPTNDQYCDWLQDQAQRGKTVALEELRRMRPTESKVDGNLVHQGNRMAATTTPIFKDAGLTYIVHDNGDVTYRRGEADILRDAEKSVKVLLQDSKTIETGLRLAVEKFGPTVALTGSDAFKNATALVAAEAGLNVSFADQKWNDVMQARRSELAADKARKAELQRLGREFAAEQKRIAEELAKPPGKQPSAEKTAPKPDPISEPKLTRKRSR